MNLIFYPNPLLREKSLIVPVKNKKEIRSIAKYMHKIMQDYNGIGLSAVQIGIPLRLFLFKESLIINPTIVSVSEETIVNQEGCLSIPGKVVDITRHKEIIINYEDKKFVTKRKKFSGYDACVIQHEIDHLNGKLIIDYGEEKC